MSVHLYERKLKTLSHCSQYIYIDQLYPEITACVCQICLLLLFSVCVNLQYDREVGDITAVFTEP